jgi:hypothetical protein
MSKKSEKRFSPQLRSDCAPRTAARDGLQKSPDKTRSHAAAAMPIDKSIKVKHWRGLHGKSGPRAAWMLEF